MNYTSIRQFYQDNATPDSCNYCHFTRKMSNLAKQLGDKSGIKKMNATFTLVDLSKRDLYLPLLSRRNARSK